ncbi:methylated-DNA--[protein]-cysteine S-methyltransferase [Paenibacillus sp. Y412MC10]|uniref:methylated-DNA--[protein]-cysteine S-methyltransferase n=1 Tax=Geobacillus sp. (strain Y412MC10) TaxID=481743 RepID=UPI0028CB5B84|nr:methylated-DNA--[protein]-cysteine S-methyltransferase [Paenibacillus sp. Y412MC10]
MNMNMITASKTDLVTLYWDRLDGDGWSLYAAATAQGLGYVGSHDGSFDELEAWAAQRYPNHEWVRDEVTMLPYITEIAEYLQGTREAFTIPMDDRGTPFQREVWQALCSIPYGQTTTYSEIAHQIGCPAAVRAVGAAIGANPVLIMVPCHRVIGKNGALTGYRGGLDMKDRLLALEARQSIPVGEPRHAD